MQYLKFEWWYSYQIWTVCPSKDCSYITWAGVRAGQNEGLEILSYFEFVAAGASVYQKHVSSLNIECKINPALSLWHSWTSGSRKRSYVSRRNTRLRLGQPHTPTTDMPNRITLSTNLLIKTFAYEQDSRLCVNSGCETQVLQLPSSPTAIARSPNEYTKGSVDSMS